MGCPLMGLRRGRGTLDPRYFRHMTPVLEGDMIALIEMYRMDPTAEPVWDGVSWSSGTGDLLLWRGMARVQPNKDWRARNRTWANEDTAEHAVRFQLNLAKNHLVPKHEWPAPLVDIQHGDIVKVTNNPNDPLLESFVFSVRNPIGASDNWHRTLLCDANLGSRYGAG